MKPHSSQSSTPIPFTPQRYAAMQAELHKLLTERKAVLSRLQAAREMGDLSENGAYKYAKLELGTLNRRLRELRYLLDRGQVIATPATNTQISFGHTVTLTPVHQPTKTLTFMVVSEFESDPAAHKLSTKSPIGQAVQGKWIGDVITVDTPAGRQQFHITAVA